MTVKKIFDKKYREWLKTISKASWEICKDYAAHKNMHVAEYMYSCLEITENDIKANGCISCILSDGSICIVYWTAGWRTDWA